MPETLSLAAVFLLSFYVFIIRSAASAYAIFFFKCADIPDELFHRYLSK